MNVLNNIITISTAKGVCYDTNNDEKDEDGLGCDTYTPSLCKRFDNDYFNSSEMCCICGGGKIGNVLRIECCCIL